MNGEPLPYGIYTFDKISGFKGAFLQTFHIEPYISSQICVQLYRQRSWIHLIEVQRFRVQGSAQLLATEVYPPLHSGQIDRKRNFVVLYRLFLDCGSGF